MAKKKQNKTEKQKEKEQQEREKKKQEIVKAYVNIVKKKRMFPTRQDMDDEGYSRDTIRHYFVNMLKLRDTAKLMYPDVFDSVVQIEDYEGKKAREKLEKKVKKSKRFFITTAVNGQFAHKGFIKSVENYCQQNNAELIIMPAHDPAHNLDNQIEWHFADEIVSGQYPIVFEQLDLNSNIHVSGVRINAKQINPTTGLGRVSQSKGSFIFASPKQSLEYVPTSNEKLPHAMMSTGACTLPNYKTTRGNSLRTAFLAHYDHVIGGIIVEVKDDEIYHFRQVQADSQGRFVDLGTMYTPNTTKTVKPKLVMGDYHAGEHDEPTIQAHEELIEELGVDTIFLHDMFNGNSISHHETNNIIKLAQRANRGELSLEDELLATSYEIDRVARFKSVKNVVMVKSNHDEVLLRWLEEGRFKNEPNNFQLGCKLADAAVSGQDPLKAGIDMVRQPSHHKKLVWLERDEDYKVAGNELGAHGDKGPNGSRGTKNNLLWQSRHRTLSHTWHPQRDMASWDQFSS